MTKLCAHCGETKPWDAFQAAARWEDGTMRRPGSYCTPCIAERKRERRRRDPEWGKRVDRRDRERINADPEKLARRRELTRENGIVHRRRMGAKPRDTQRRAPVEVAALQEAMRESELANAELARRLGVDERRVRAMLEARRWQPETVARVVHALGLDPQEVAA